MKRCLVILLLLSVFGISGAFADISYSDMSYLNKEVNTGHYISSMILGGTMNLYAGNTLTGVTLTTIKMLSYGMIVYGKMNFYSGQSLSTYAVDNNTLGQNIPAPSINYTSLGILAGGILISGLTSAFDIVTGLDTLETKKEYIITKNNIQLNLNATASQNQISVGIKF